MGTGQPAKGAVKAVSGRLVSLDAFRGFTIAAMVLVNNPGDWGAIYGPLGHAKWNGWTFTDWIFPFFLFIGGVSMTFSLGRRVEAGGDKPALLKALAKRAAIIFFLGFLLNLIPQFDFGTVRVPGVLQRIALCTLFAAPIVVYFDWKKQCAFIVGLFAIYSVLMLWVPVPDPAGHVAAGALEPGRDFGAWVDRAVFGHHVWTQAKTWDPEGLVSTLPAICSQLFGVLVGRFLLTDRTPAKKTVMMVIAGAVCVGLGELIGVTFMPINKSLWTVSYSIAMTGFGLLVFSLFYWLMDASPKAAVKKQSALAFTPFTIYGMNALFIFALSGLIAKMLGFIKIAHGGGGARASLKTLLYAPIKALPIAPVNASLLFAIAFNVLMFAVAWAMWKKKWFVKV
jgi:predicted acyltransferase